MQGKSPAEVTAALKKLNSQVDPLHPAGLQFSETFETLQDAAVTPAQVVLVISDFRKFEFSLAELGLRVAKSGPPATAINQ